MKKTIEELKKETCKFDWCGDFWNGLALVKIGSKRTFIKPDGTDLYTGKIPSEYTCKFDEGGNFKNGLAWVKIGSNEYFINTLGFRFNTKDRATAIEMNKQLLKDFPENSLKRFIFEEII